MVRGVAAIVVTHLGGPRLERCVASLRSQEVAPAEILVVVSNPQQVPLPEGVQALRGAGRLDYGEAVNLGACEASGELLLVLNDDTMAESGFIAALLEAHREHPDALLQPRILLAGAEGVVENVGHGLFPDGHNQPRGRARPDGASFDVPGTVGVVSGAAFLAPRDRFEALGGFDASLGPFGDDLDLSLRWIRAGGALRYVPSARIHHELGASYGRAGLRKIVLVERNRVRAALRSMPAACLLGAPAWTALRWGLMAGAAAAGRGWGGQLPRGASLAAVAGALSGYAHAPGALLERRRDAPGWARGERAMLQHLWRERARVGDFL